MADNIDVTPGTGKTIAADEISSVLYQRVKFTLGADAANDGDVSTTNPMPVTSVDLAPATQNVTTQDLVSATASGANSQSIITGTPTANSAASFAITSENTIIVQVSGTWTGTLQAEISQDSGTTWYIRGVHQAGTSYTVASFTANFAGGLNIGGYTNFRIRATAAITGTAVVKVTESRNINSVYIANSIKISDATTPSQQMAVDSSGRISALANSAGDVASGASDSGNPVKIGGVGRTTNPTAVTDGQRVNSIFDKLGKQVVVGSIRDLKLTQTTTITASTAETTVLTAVASTFLDVYGVVIANSSATGTNITFKDATAGTTRFTIYVPAGETRGFMLPESGAYNQAVVNTNWTATSSASVTSLFITMFSVKNI